MESCGTLLRLVPRNGADGGAFAAGCLAPGFGGLRRALAPGESAGNAHQPAGQWCEVESRFRVSNVLAKWDWP